jgi:hypothetical protein
MCSTSGVSHSLSSGQAPPPTDGFFVSKLKQAKAGSIRTLTFLVIVLFSDYLFSLCSKFELTFAKCLRIVVGMDREIESRQDEGGSFFIKKDVSYQGCQMVYFRTKKCQFG